MGYIIVLLIVLIAAVMLAPTPAQANAKASSLDAFNFPRSKEGDPCPYIVGRVRMRSPNTLWYGDFRTVPIKQETGGMFSSKSVIVGYKYYLGLDLALALGPGVALRRIWAGKDVIWEGYANTVTNIEINKPNLFGGSKRGGGLAGTATFYPGTFGQSRDPYLAVEADPDVPGYGGLAHIVFKDFYWGTAANIPTLHFELERQVSTFPSANNIMPNGMDMNPIAALYDLLTVTWSMLGARDNLIHLESWLAAADTLYAEEIGMSLVISQGNNGKDVFQDIMQLISGVMYQDPVDGQLHIRLIRDDYNVDALPVFNQDNVIKLKRFSKQLWEGTFNQVRVKYTNRVNAYAEGVALDHDFANINQQRRVKSTDVAYPMCYDSALANRLARRDSAVLSVPLYKATLITNRQGAALRPGDLLVLEWEPYNLVQVVMRVQKVDLGELVAGVVKLEVAQDQFASGLTTFASPPPPTWSPIDRIAPELLFRKVRELSYWELLTGLTAANFNALTPTQGIVNLAAARPSAATIDYLYKIRLNGAGDYEGLEYVPFTPSGTLQTGMTYLGTTFTLIGAVDIDQVVLNSIILIDNELMYLTNYNTGTGVATVRRAVLDTVATQHSIGARVWFLGSGSEQVEFIYEETDSLQIKMMAHTDSDERDEAGVPIDVIGMDQRANRPYPPAMLRINGFAYPTLIEGTEVTLTWRERNRLTQGETIYDEDDATVAPEADTTYTARYYEDGVLEATHAGLTTTTDTFVPSGQCDLTVELWSVRAGLDSQQRHNYTLRYSPPVNSLLTEDGGYLLTEAGGRLIQE